MTGREKIEAALSREGTPEIPAVICYEDLFQRDHWDELTTCPWWYVNERDPERQLEWRRDAIERIGQDWFEIVAGYTRSERANLHLEGHGDEAFLIDRAGNVRQRLTRPHIGGWTVTGGPESIHPARLAETHDEIDALLPPLPACDPAEIPCDGRGDLAAALQRQFGSDRYPIYLVIGSPFWRLYHLWGFEGLMMMTASRPDLVQYGMQRFLERAVWQVREAKALGAAGVWLEECFTDQISPAAFQSLNAPVMGSLIEEVRGAGLASFYYYCGNPSDRLDLLLNLGADALALEEGKKGWAIDIAEVAEYVQGRCTLLGNLDAINLLPRASEEELRAEITRQIAAGRRNGSRFIMSLGSPVTPGTSVEKVRLYCDLVHDLGTC